VSIVAEILAEMNGRSGLPLSQPGDEASIAQKSGLGWRMSSELSSRSSPRRIATSRPAQQLVRIDGETSAASMSQSPSNHKSVRLW